MLIYTRVSALRNVLSGSHFKFSFSHFIKQGLGVSKSNITGLIEFINPENMEKDTKFMPLYTLEVDIYTNNRPEIYISWQPF